MKQASAESVTRDDVGHLLGHGLTRHSKLFVKRSMHLPRWLPNKARMTMLILPTADTAMMNLFLQQVSQEFATFFVIMQVDQANWHRSEDLQMPENIRLVFQPPYRPELNPVEHLWDELREKYFFNHAFSSLDTLQEQLCLGLNDLAAQPDLIGSMTLFPHFCISNKNAI